MKGNNTMTIETIQKRDGRMVAFDESKIADAVFKAAKAVGGADRSIATELASVVTHFLQKRFKDVIPGIEDIQDLVEEILIKNEHAKTAKAYILYREGRAKVRNSLRVRKQVTKSGDTTDAALMVDLVSKDESFPWDKRKIAMALEKEAELSEGIAQEIANVVEGRIFASGMNRITTSLIRELVDNELFERGYNAKLEKQTSIGMPKFDIEQLIFKG